MTGFLSWTFQYLFLTDEQIPGPILLSVIYDKDDFSGTLTESLFGEPIPEIPAPRTLADGSC